MGRSRALRELEVEKNRLQGTRIMEGGEALFAQMRKRKKRVSGVT